MKPILIFLIVAISIYFVFPLVNDYIFKGGFENLGSLIEKRNFYTNITSMGTYAIDPSSNALWKYFLIALDLFFMMHIQYLDYFYQLIAQFY